jgi:hypothetical protein
MYKGEPLGYKRKASDDALGDAEAAFEIRALFHANLKRFNVSVIF